MVVYEIRKNDELYGKYEDLNEMVEDYNELVKVHNSDSIKIDSYEVLNEFQSEERMITLTRHEAMTLTFYLARNVKVREAEKEDWLSASKDSDGAILYNKMLSNSLYVEREIKDIENILSKLD